MRHQIIRRGIPVAGILAVFFAATAVAVAQPPPPGDIIAAGLQNPRGISLDTDGTTVIVSEVGGGQLTRITADGQVSVAASGLPTASFFSPAAGADEVGGPSSAFPLGGGFILTLSEAPTSEFQSVYFLSAQGDLILIADMGAYEQANNTDGALNPAMEPDLLSNPYDVLPDGQGGLYVSDSGANAILHIAEDGTITPYAIFDALPNPLFPAVGGPTMQQVPTGMAIGPDGALYVGVLTGFPFPEGGALVYRLEDLNDDGNALGDGEVTVYASGLTSVTDIAFDTDGSLLVVQFSTNMLAQELGQIVRVSGGTNEVVVDGLITPTGIVVTTDGRVIVSQEFAGLVSDVTGVIAGDAPAPPAVPAPADTGNSPMPSSSTLPLALALVAIVGAALVGVRRVTAR